MNLHAAMPNAVVRVGGVAIGNSLPLALIAGPCQLESRDHAMKMAERLVSIARRANIGLIYKTSFDKANRTSLSGRRGMGL
jgi:2-dehydro-3-deoxyphosphooctonate aldolase (KDO 8-P synthase)